MHQGIIFLIALGGIWMLFATIQDIKKREVANWLNYSLIIFALGARFFYSLFFNDGFGFFLQGIIGLGIFFVLGNLLYSLKVFAGGDTKLMISLGAILPFSNSFFINLKIYALFFCVFFFVGAVYGILFSLILVLKNLGKFKKEFSRQFRLEKKFFYVFSILGFLVLCLGFFEEFMIYFGLLIFFFPLLYIYAKSVEEGIMILNMDSFKLTEGDWLYKDLKVGKKIIHAKWDGLSRMEIREIRKKLKKVRIKQGIPFVPVFLISFTILIFLFMYFPFENYGILLGSHIFPLGFSIFSVS
jgi:Flp pilus assembly protein protease CpaA